MCLGAPVIGWTERAALSQEAFDLYENLPMVVGQAEAWRKEFAPYPDVTYPAAPCRQSVMTWLVDTVYVLGLCPKVMATAVQIFDAYVFRSRAEAQAPPSLESMHGVLVAAVGIAHKLETNNECPVPRGQLLVHLLQHRLSVEELWQTEQDVLRALDFQVLAASPRDVLDTLVYICSRTLSWSGFQVPSDSGKRAPSVVARLAGYLCDLTLLDVDSYAFSPAVLAASCLLVAMRAAGAPVDVGRHVYELLDRVAATDSLDLCMRRISQLWGVTRGVPFGSYRAHASELDPLDQSDVREWVAQIQEPRVES